VFEYAQRKGRLLLTNDTDFFSLIEDRRHHGILYLTTQRAAIGRIIRDVARLIDTSQPEDLDRELDA
jgi:predicted nuclease of predicted toxin-antitoxin system